MKINDHHLVLLRLRLFQHYLYGTLNCDYIAGFIARVTMSKARVRSLLANYETTIGKTMRLVLAQVCT